MPAPRPTDQTGSTATGFLLAVVLLAVLAVGAFFVLGGDAEVDVKPPAVDVSTSPAPEASTS